MPIYEFVCKACGHHFELLVSMTGGGQISCPSCHGRDVRKRISAFGIGGGSSRLKQASTGCATCSSKSCSTCK
ncbi:MAG: zinc ribbon domain-containing protein [Acidobacteriota bacterium]|nr:zinc ribbon domain-containing protein [Acidobacteriota bacterium]